jgi:hypothetical protein
MSDFSDKHIATRLGLQTNEMQQVIGKKRRENPTAPTRGARNSRKIHKNIPTEIHKEFHSTDSALQRQRLRKVIYQISDAPVAAFAVTEYSQKYSHRNSQGISQHRSRRSQLGVSTPVRNRLLSTRSLRRLIAQLQPLASASRWLAAALALQPKIVP